VRLRPIAIACVLASLAACKPDTPATETASVPAPTPAPAATGATDASATPAVAAIVGEGPQRLRGAGIMGKDGYGLTLCGETNQRILDLDAPAQAALETFMANGKHEFQVDAWGLPEANGHLRVSSIERLYTEGPGCDEKLDGFDFRAHGTEPFWGLDVAEGQLLLSRPEKGALSGAAKDLGGGEGTRKFEADTAEGKLVASFAAGSCNDGMSDGQFGWTAEVSLGAQHFKGCAYAGLGGKAK
jgi:uncharacterized membrane protein